MKHLKKFNEELVPKQEVYKRGEVLVWIKKNTSLETVKDISKKLGYEVISEMFDGDAYLIKCLPGKEEICGSDFVDNYPEFFESFERLDIRSTHLYEKIDDIIDDIEELRAQLGKVNNFGKSVLSKDWNNKIEDVIYKLNKIKTV